MLQCLPSSPYYSWDGCLVRPVSVSSLGNSLDSLLVGLRRFSHGLAMTFLRVESCRAGCTVIWAEGTLPIRHAGSSLAVRPWISSLTSSVPPWLWVVLGICPCHFSSCLLHSVSLPTLAARAPKSHIGGSGMTASRGLDLYQAASPWIFPSITQSLSWIWVMSGRHFCVRHLIDAPLFQYLLTAWAPKSHIGGSGMTASRKALHSPCVLDCQCSLAALHDKVVFRKGCWDFPAAPPLPWVWAAFGLGPSHVSPQLPWHVNLPPPLTSAWAPKSLIGGSGLTASREVICHMCLDAGGRRNATGAFDGSVEQPLCQPCANLALPMCARIPVSAHIARHLDFAARNTIPWILAIVGAFLVPLARGFLALIFLGILRLCLGTCRAPTSLLGRVCSLPLRGKCGELVVPLGKATRPDAILDWSVLKPRRDRRPGRPKHCLWHLALGSLGAVLGIPATPMPFAVSFPCACWLLSPVGVAGMAREGWPDDWPHSRPEVPIVTPVITEGVCDAWSPCHDSERATRAEDNICIRDLPWPAGHEAAGNDAMLGCYVYTPHYCPVALAVCMPPHADLRYAMDVLTDCAPGVPEGLFNAMVPIHPQRVPGYLSVIRFPAHIRGVHDGYAAVICDLTRSGGAYFATILPKHLSHETLVQFLAPLVPPSDEPMRFFIGCRTKAWPLEALITLRDGDAINVVQHLDTTVLQHRAESLHDRASWGPMHQFYEPDFKQATCVLHREQRFCIDTSPNYGIDLFDQIVSALRLDAAKTAICSFPIEDLEVQGVRCRTVTTVADVAAPTGGYREPARQDFFVLCDLRPLGLKPQFVYAHLPRLHLPSLIADLGIALPAAFQVGIEGARVSGDVVRISCNCTLLFYAKEAEPDDSVLQRKPSLMILFL